MSGKLPHGRAHFNRVFLSYRMNAGRRGIKFFLTKEEFEDLVTKNCFYCGAKPSARKNKALKSHMPMNGVDRVDNTVGYLKSNCVPACPECNMAKRMLTVRRFLQLVRRIYRYHKAYFVGS